MTKPAFFALPLCVVLPAKALAQQLPLEEVIVSAQHRQQSLQEVPFSLTVLNGQQLDLWRLENINQLVALTPGLSGWQQGLSTPIYAIRGISSNSFGIGGEASVAVFVDDAYIGRINSTSVRMPDVERVEILKGPQGTLLGRNASAGAIHYHTRLPTAEPELDLRVAGGEYQHREVALTANQPLVDDRLMMRLTGFYREQQGDARDRINRQHVGGEEGHGLRLAMRYRLDRWDVNLSLSDQELDSGGLGYETLDPTLAAAGGVRPDPFDDQLATNTRTFDRIASRDANLRIDWQAGDHWQLRSITAWHNNESPNDFDVDGSAVFISSAGFIERESETFSQELRFSGQFNQIDWVAGVSYFAEEVRNRIELGYSDTNRLAGVTISPADFGQPFPDFVLCDAVSDLVFGPCLDSVAETAFNRGEYRSSGAYADIAWSVNDRLTVSAGLRYSHDDKEFEYRSAPVRSVTTALNALRTAPLNPAGNLLGYSTEGWQRLAEQWDDWQPRLAAKYQLGDRHSLFASLSRGYKAGGFEPTATPESSVYAPETVASADIGIRGQGWSNRLSYSVSLFRYDYKDYQVQVINNGIFNTINGEGVSGNGLEWELAAWLNSRWQLRVNGAHTDSEFDQLETDEGDFEGNRTILTPRHSGALVLDYRSGRFAWGSAGFNWRSEYQSEIFYTVQNTDDASRGDLDLHHVTLSYYSPLQQWQFSLVLRNIFDEDFTIFEQDVGAGPVARRGPPRYLGVDIKGSF